MAVVLSSNWKCIIDWDQTPKLWISNWFTLLHQWLPISASHCNSCIALQCNAIRDILLYLFRFGKIIINNNIIIILNVKFLENQGPFLLLKIKKKLFFPEVEICLMAPFMSLTMQPFKKKKTSKIIFVFQSLMVFQWLVYYFLQGGFLGSKFLCHDSKYLLKTLVMKNIQMFLI